MSAGKTLLAAAWVATMQGPIIRDGAIVFENGRILAVGESKLLREAHPDASVVDLGAAIALPGLVNAHTHLELSGCQAGEAPEGTFGQWLLSLPRRIGRDSGVPPEELFTAATRRGIDQSIRFGVTCVGDISQQMHLTRPVLSESPIRSVSYGEVIGLAARRSRFEELLALAVDRLAENEKLRVGLTPHSPYTVDLPGFRECLELSRRHGFPLATHLAETPDERAFLEEQRGTFREMWESLGHWRDGVQTLAASPIKFARAIGLLDHPTLLAHVNYCDDDELDLLAAGQASVVYCPRTHAYFGHPPHRWREMLARGINVAVGTDSCASSPDLNLIDDLRLVHRLAPDFPPEHLWRMASIAAAKAIWRDAEIGSIATGKFADFAIFDVSTNQPLAEILESDRQPAQVWIGGVQLTGRT